MARRLNKKLQIVMQIVQIVMQILMQIVQSVQIVMQQQLNYATAGLLESVSCQAISLGGAPSINQCVY